MISIAELQQMLKENHVRFSTTIQELSDEDFLKSASGKWTAGQQLEHIIKSVAPVNMAFGMPAFMLRLMFGKTNRPSRTYDQLVEKYKQKLSAGGRATNRFLPAPVTLQQRQELFNRLEKLNTSLNRKLNGFSEQQLDILILPHPLLGKLTFREMIYFTIYHVTHHEKQVIANLERQIV